MREAAPAALGLLLLVLGALVATTEWWRAAIPWMFAVAFVFGLKELVGALWYGLADLAKSQKGPDVVE